MQNVVPDNLREANLDQLLYLALACDSGGDLMTSGLVTALTDLEVVYEALVWGGGSRKGGGDSPGTEPAARAAGTRATEG